MRARKCWRVSGRTRRQIHTLCMVFAGSVVDKLAIPTGLAKAPLALRPAFRNGNASRSKSTFHVVNGILAVDIGFQQELERESVRLTAPNHEIRTNADETQVSNPLRATQPGQACQLRGAEK